MKYYVITTNGTKIFEDVKEFRSFFKDNRDKILFYRVGR